MFHYGTVPARGAATRDRLWFGRQKTLMIRTLLVAAAWMLSRAGAPRPTLGIPPSARRTRRPGPKGRADAPVTVYEMSDFQCPYCREFALDDASARARVYPGGPRSGFVYINLPLTSVPQECRSRGGAALCAAASSGFGRCTDLLFRHQDSGPALPSPERISRARDAAGLDQPGGRCVASGATAGDVRADAERARRRADQYSYLLYRGRPARGRGTGPRSSGPC